ncbi:hypothetical protein D3C85_1945920 [compost metagenome]
MRRVGLARHRIEHLLNVAVVGGNQTFTTSCEGCFNHATQAFIEHLDRLDGSIE